MDGHEAGYNILATGLRERGIEVILGGAQLPEEAAETAIQEDVDFIGFRNMAGDPIYLVETLLHKLKEKGADIPIIAGGIIRPREVTKLKEMGVIEVFGPGTSIDSISSLMKQHHRE
jgi:methylmalonyl-CoA mutase C-terminal domain/subunit